MFSHNRTRSLSRVTLHPRRTPGLDERNAQRLKVHCCAYMALTVNVAHACIFLLFLVQQWLQLVSKRVRSTVVGGVPAGSWAAREAGNEEQDAMSVDGADDGGNETETSDGCRPQDTGSPPPSSTASTAYANKAGAGEGPSDSSVVAAATGETSLSSGASNLGGEITVSAAARGGNVEAELRQRLLLAMRKTKTLGRKPVVVGGSARMAEGGTLPPGVNN